MRAKIQFLGQAPPTQISRSGRRVQLQQTVISPLRLVESQRALLVDGHRDLGTGYRESTVAEFL